MKVHTIAPVLSTRRSVAHRQGADVLLNEADHDGKEDIRRRPNRDLRVPSGRRIVDKSPIATTPATTSPMAITTGPFFFDDCVCASLPVCVAMLVDDQADVVV